MMENGISSMETECVVNTANLALDQVIELNKALNMRREKYGLEEEEYVEDAQPAYKSRSRRTKNGLHSSDVNLTTELLRVENRLRKTPGFGSRLIHQRLGYFNFMTRNRKISRAQKSVNNARHISWRKNHMKHANSFITVRNPLALKKGHPFKGNSPLTRDSVLKFNQVKKIVPTAGHPSYSTASSRFTIERYSVATCLNPAIQKEMRDSLQSSEGCEDFDVENFQPDPQSTNMLTHCRFSTYF